MAYNHIMTKDEIRKITVSNIMHMLVKQQLIGDDDRERIIAEVDLTRDVLFIPVTKKTSSTSGQKCAVCVTFLHSGNVFNNSCGEELFKAASDSEFDVIEHIWILDKQQSTARFLSNYFSIDRKNKVDNISNGTITVKEEYRKQNLLVFAYYTFHGNMFSKFYFPFDNHIVRNKFIANNHKNAKMKHNDIQAMLMNAKPGDRLDYLRFSDMTGHTFYSRMVE